MTKLRDPTTAAGAFGQSIYQLKVDRDHGDAGVERAARITGKIERTLYKWVDPDGAGPPIGIAEAIDEVHRREGGVEINLDAWLERRELNIAGIDIQAGPDPRKLLERIVSDMADTTRALSAGRGKVQEVWRLTSEMADAYAALTRAIMQRLDEEGAARNRRADDRPPTRLTVTTRPTLVRGG